MPFTYKLPIPRYRIDRDFLAETMPEGDWIKVEDLVLQTQPLDFTHERFLNMQERVKASGFDLLLIEENRRYGVVTDKGRHIVECFDSLDEIGGWLRGLFDGVDRFEMGDGVPVLTAKYLSEVDSFGIDRKMEEPCGG